VSGGRRVVRAALIRAEQFDRAVARAESSRPPAARRCAIRALVRRHARLRPRIRLPRARLRTASEEDAGTAERLLERADAIGDRLPSAKETQEDFRAGCE
jgi:hypothetical protein